ncbi:MAG: ATP-dependent RNA helicase DbpA [Alteromonadaceae bacterium]|nr:MAG: ATP-dependent RNA helicase DbpA [Alteromonadaceae bacterium]
MSNSAFSTLKLHSGLLENLSSLGYTEMTPIQEQSLPLILDGKDVIAQGKTGSGKTAAFGLGLLQLLKVKQFRVQTLIICPTRELADQVATAIRKLARAIHNIKVLTLCGGMPFGPQVGSLEHGAHIVVGTPGRLDEHLRKGNLNLEHLNILILDEADRMLEMGFQDAIDAIVDAAPKQRQTLLFSATFPPQIKAIADRVTRNATMVKVESRHDNSSIEQQFFKITTEQSREQALRLLLLHHKPESCLVFCRTKRDTQNLADALQDEGFAVVALHGDLEQRDRDRALVRFANKSANILIATDVAARGLDIEDMDLVINYEMANDTEIHVHRIGRTGRAGSQGKALTLFNDKDGYKISMLDELLGGPVQPARLPSTSLLGNQPRKPSMTTIQIDGGKKQKVRPGDILGALTGENGIQGSDVGKIQMFDNAAYVAVKREVAKRALDKITQGKLKGRAFRARQIKH